MHGRRNKEIKNNHDIFYLINYLIKRTQFEIKIYPLQTDYQKYECLHTP